MQRTLRKRLSIFEARPPAESFTLATATRSWLVGMLRLVLFTSKEDRINQEIASSAYQPFYVAAEPSLFGVAAATVTDVCGKRSITSIKVEFNMGPRRAAARLLNRVTETKQAVASETMLGQREV